MTEVESKHREALPDLEWMEYLGQGQAKTWRARDRGHEVIVKIFEFEELDEWKGIDLFRREITVLKGLNHPGIPKYVRHVEVEDDGLRIYLIQEFVDAPSLEQIRATPADLEHIARGVLEILFYLQSFSPPLVHRDIKPSNILYRAPDVFLIDFGAVQLVTPSDEGGSTIVGTTGFMPYEQLMGRAVPASDLYALGMTLVRLATGRAPDTLPVHKMKTLWENQLVLTLRPAFKGFISRLIEPIVDDRIQDASSALKLLNEGAGETRLARRPIETKLILETSPGALRIKPPSQAGRLIAFTSIITLVLIGIAIFGGLKAIPVLAGLVFLPILFWDRYTRVNEITIYPKRYTIKSPKGIVDSGPINNFVKFELISHGQGKVPAAITTSNSHRLSVMASAEEIEWLNATINNFVSECDGDE